MWNNSFNSHHSAWGAYMSFVLGKYGAGGGIVTSYVNNPGHSIYAGFTREHEVTKIFPFASLERNNFEAAFGLDAGDDITNVEFFPENDITREYKPATDTFSAQGLSIKIFSPFAKVPQIKELSVEEKKKYLLPAILIEIEMDNTNSSSEVSAFLGMKGYRRLLNEYNPELIGGASGRSKGFATLPEKDMTVDIGMNLVKQLAVGKVTKYRLGDEIIISFKVNAGEKRNITFALAAYEGGLVTSGIDAGYAYTECFNDIEEVLKYALDNAEYYKKLSYECDKELEASNLNPYRKFLFSHSVHSYLASTELLKKPDGSYIWVVNEGEYAMMNTLDLTIDHLFWELKYHPWTVENNLDLFASRYSYKDEVRTSAGDILKGGISFCHDMGVGNIFSIPGQSSYEMTHDLEHINGCFSFMTMEQLLNWSLCACLYATSVKDINWLERNKNTLIDCLNSIIARDTNRDGIMDVDSTKSGKHGEITTYDSLDSSLGQARNNLYLAVKTWSALVCMSSLFGKLNLHNESAEALGMAMKAAECITSKFIDAEGYIPAVFENGNTSRIIPAIEALVYPYHMGLNDVLSKNGPFGSFIETLCKHTLTVLTPGICIDAKTGAWKISSTSLNTWMSKVFISQFVSEKVLGLKASLDNAAADKAHTFFQTEGCSEYCVVDQVNAEEGTAIGSRLYPRLITSVLWL